MEAITAGQSHIPGVLLDDLAPHREAGRLTVVADYDELHGCDALFICVTTSYDLQRAADLSFIRSASRSIQSRLRPGQLVVLQSTNYPIPTEKVVLPMLE